MEVGTEISQKIRSAIKAKLMELGSYVDDELPDYIMVMVANKKTKQQMTDDLCLFLGSNTDVFTTWLHGLLAKLQTLSADSSKSDKSKSSKEKRKEKHSKSKESGSGESKKEKRKASKKGDGDAPKAKSARTADPDKEENRTTHAKEIASVSVIQSEKVNDHPLELESNLDLDLEQNNSKSVTSQEGNTKSDDIEDVRQLLVTETHGDELAEELETTEVGIEKLASSTSVAPPNITKESSVASDNENIIDLNKNRSNSREAQAEVLSSTRKRKCPSSVVSAVRRVDDLNEDDEFTPAVASVVKVTSRRSSVPQSMQANSESTSLAEEEKSKEEGKMTDGNISLEFVKQALSQVLEQWKNKEDDIGTFCKSVEMTLRKMSDGDLAISKLKIQKILFDYEMACHKQMSAAKNSKEQSNSLSALSSNASKSTNQEIAASSNSCIGRSDTAGNSTASSKNPHPTCPSTSQDNDMKAQSNKRQDKDFRNSGESVRGNKNSEVTVRDRIIFGPKQKEDGEAIQSTNSKQTDLKNTCSVESCISLSSTEGRSVTTAVSSTVVESSGSDSPSSSHPSNSVQVKWSTPSNNSKKSLTADSVQRTKNNQSLHPTILVSSLHQNRHLGSDSPSVLRNSFSHDSPLSKTSQLQPAEGTPDSSKELSPEQLKVLAKNLKITVMNKRALRPEEKSNSDESTSDDSEDESDSEEEESDEEVVGDSAQDAKMPNDTRASAKE